MIYNTVRDDRLSLLGLGTMRFPMHEDKTIDEEKTQELVDYALANGINYFDTAYFYHSRQSEIVVGKCLSAHPRESYYLADKFPGCMGAESYDAAAIFEEQLKKCGVDYFDYYLLHNVSDSSFDAYCDPRWNIIPYVLEQKRLGRIRHLGFSTHASLDTLRKFLDLYGQHMEFCQIQMNYLDWTMQNAEEKYRILTERGIPVWVMEPVRGGKLANLPEPVLEKMRQYRPDASAAAWALQWVMQHPNVKMILSGMSSMEQMQDNIRTFSERKPFSQREEALLQDLAERLKKQVPCTACRYCCDGCPMELNIPELLRILNGLQLAPTAELLAQYEALPEEQQASACVGCGQCASVCPQKIDIPAALNDLDALYHELSK